MKLHCLVLLTAMIMVLPLRGMAQPGPDPRINPLSTCNEDYLSAEYIFVGKVDAVKEISSSYVRPFWKTRISIETSLKGRLRGGIELTLVKPLLPPIPESEVIGKRFIFTANQVTNAQVSGLFSNAWSTSVDSVPKDVFTRVIAGIRAVLRGVPQPRIVGTVREQSLETGFQANDGRPLAGLAVVASSKEGQKFDTKTDAQGRFQFDKLPVGMYTVVPILPKKMDLVGYSSAQDQNSRYIPVNERICSLELNFIASEMGRVTGRIEGVKGQAVNPLLFLYPVDPKTLQINPQNYRRAPTEITLSANGSESIVHFSFDQIPVGSYLLSIDALAQTASTLYYPGVSHSDDARVIEVVAGKPTELLMKLP